MSHNILITGASGYLGGSIVEELTKTSLPSHGTIFALVRSESQAAAVQKYGVTPLTFDPRNEEVVQEIVVAKEISVVFWLIDAVNVAGQPAFLKALATVKNRTGRDTHFIFTSGAKIFSAWTGAPSDRPLLDTDEKLYEIQKEQEAQQPHQSFNKILERGVSLNNLIIEQAEALGVRSYIFIPCIVYGRGQGFGKQISIQTVALIRAAKALRKVYRFDTERTTWPVSHIDDTTSLYIALLRSILAGEDCGYGKQGYYLASSGSVAWDDIYETMANALYKRGIVDSPEVFVADGEAIDKMAQVLGSPAWHVPCEFGGECTLTAKHGQKVGWSPKYQPQHILDTADEEVELVLQHV